MKRNLIIEIGLAIFIASIIALFMHYLISVFAFWQYLAWILILYLFTKLVRDPRTRRLAKLCLGFAILFTVYLILSATFPMSFRVKSWMATNADFAVSESMADSINTKQRLIYEAVKDRKLDSALRIYKHMLVDNDPKGAERYMDSLKNVWTKSDIDRVMRNPDTENPSLEPAPVIVTDPKLIDQGKVYVIKAGEIASSRRTFTAGERVHFDVISGSVNRIDLHHQKVFRDAGDHFADVNIAGPLFFEGVSDRSEIMIR